jgi:hypothetical protein
MIVVCNTFNYHANQILGAFADAAGVQHNFLKTGRVYRPFDLLARLGSQRGRSTE